MCPRRPVAIRVGLGVAVRLSLTVEVEAVALNHALEGRAVDAEQTRGGLLVAARVGEHARDVASLQLREREERLVGWRRWSVVRVGLVRGRVVGAEGCGTFVRRSGLAHALWQVFGTNEGGAEGDRADDGGFKQ